MLLRLTRLGGRSRVFRAVLFLSIAYILLRHYTGSNLFVKRSPESVLKSLYPKSVKNIFQGLSVTGFTNLGLQDDFECADLAVISDLSVTPSIELDDDLIEVAKSVSHPLVNYTSQGKGFTFEKLVERTWSRAFGSSVWLDEYQVFLTVSRVYFYDKGVRRWSIISFIRAQIHDAEWNHVQGYKLNWQGEIMVFPRIFEVPIPFKPGGCFNGPEDPRIIIEHGVPNAEPVVVFNMQEDPDTIHRSMYIFRPFSNVTARLTLESSDDHEKNWAPFFMEPNISSTDSDTKKRQPSHWLHFVYEFQHLSIVRCHIFNGSCTWIFQQKTPESFNAQHGYTEKTFTGGSNLEPLHITTRPGIHSFIGFPRTHTDDGCLEEATYRPELTILSTNTTHFWYDYASTALTFGNSMLKPHERANPCTAGRILLINSIAYFDTADRDEMTVSFTVNDASVGVATIKHVRQLVEALPPFRDAETWRDTRDIPERMDVTHRIAGCVMDSAKEYALQHTTPEMREAERIRIAKKEKGID